MKTVDEFKNDYIDNLESGGNLTKVDIIEQNLNAIDAAIQFTQKWISVDDELPEQIKKLIGNKIKSENVIVKRKWEDTGKITIEINCRFRPSPRIGFLWNIEYEGSSIIEWRPIDLIEEMEGKE